jgi:ABC-type branched-subunit amino acid transport system substrate-binding protein
LSLQTLVSAQTIEAELPGRSIYLQGKGAEPASALLAGPGITVPSAGFACAQCHLEDGSGSREGGVKAPDIRFQHLAQPYSGLRDTGRQHPPYDEQSLIRAIRQGVDPAGNPLHAAMPRYGFSDNDMRALIDYLKRLDNLSARGVSDAAIRVGTLQPSTGPLLPISHDVRRLLHGYFKQLNDRGGVYGRRLELVVVEYDPNRMTTQTAALETLLAGQGVICTLANLGFVAASQTGHELKRRVTPDLAPLGITSDSDLAQDAQVFYLYASLAEQGAMLADYFLSKSQNRGSRVALVHANDAQVLGSVHGLKQRLAEQALIPVAEQAYQLGDSAMDKLPQQLVNVAVDTVFFLGDSTQLQRFLDIAEELDWHPEVLALADLSSSVATSISASQAEHLSLLTTLSIPDPDSPAMSRFYLLSQQAGVDMRHQGFQLSVYAAARLLQEGLERLGRTPTPKGLVAALNRLWKFETGTTPPLTFNANRRSGARGGGIVAIDPETHGFYRVTKWREL